MSRAARATGAGALLAILLGLVAPQALRSQTPEPLFDPLANEYLNALPTDWTQQDKEEFLIRLGEETEKELRKNLKEKVITEPIVAAAVQRGASVAFSHVAARAEMRARNVTVEYLVLHGGKSKQEAEWIVRNTLAQLKSDYRFRQRISNYIPAVSNYRSYRRLLRSPEGWARRHVAEAVIKGLGKRIVGVWGLADDLLTIGRACYYTYQVCEAWATEEETRQFLAELETELAAHRAAMSPEDRDRLADVLERERQFFDRHPVRGQTNAGTSTAAAANSVITWDQSARGLRDRVGERFTFHCPNNSRQGGPTIWGSGPYLDSSAICMAAVHAGVISFDGGTVVLQMNPGADAYLSTRRNGVTSQPHLPGGAASFSFVTN